MECALVKSLHDVPRKRFPKRGHEPLYAHPHLISYAAVVRKLEKDARALFVGRHAMRPAAHLDAEVPRRVVELAQAAEALQPRVPIAQVKPIPARAQARKNLHGRAARVRIPTRVKDDAHARGVRAPLVKQPVPHPPRVLECARALVRVHELVPERRVERRRHGRADADEILHVARGVHDLLQAGYVVRVGRPRADGHARHLPEHVRVEVREDGGPVLLHVLHDLEVVLPGRDGAVVEFEGRKGVEYGRVALRLEWYPRALADGLVGVECLGETGR